MKLLAILLPKQDLFAAPILDAVALALYLLQLLNHEKARLQAPGSTHLPQLAFQLLDPGGQLFDSRRALRIERVRSVGHRQLHVELEEGPKDD